MVVKKNELTDFLTESQREMMGKIEEMIDAALMKDYVPGNKVMVKINERLHERVREEITKRYRDAGWNIEFKSDQKEGKSIELS